MKVLSIAVFGAGVIATFATLALELWWRYHNEILQWWQCRILLISGIIGMCLLFIGMFFINITKWR
jgi:hypothetical protein